MLTTPVVSPMTQPYFEKVIVFVYCTNEIVRLTEFLFLFFSFFFFRRQPLPEHQHPNKINCVHLLAFLVSPWPKAYAGFPILLGSSLSLRNSWKEWGETALSSSSSSSDFWPFWSGSIWSVNLQDSTSQEPRRGASGVLLTYSFLVFFCWPLWEQSREPL